MITGEVLDTVDNCSMIMVSFNDVTVTGECPAIDTIYRIWVAEDICGNTFSQTQIITRIDTVPPIFTVPPDITILCTQGFGTWQSGQVALTPVRFE